MNEVIVKTRMSIFITLIFSFSILTGCLSAQDNYIKDNFNKKVVMIPMRDGVKLMTIVYSPKEMSSDCPIILYRTPYRIGNYENGQFPRSGRFSPDERFVREGYIFVMQDVRGKFMSEGKYENMRAYIPNKKTPNDVDESSDTYDTIDWLIKNVPGNNGRVGIWGISYPGFYAAMAAIESHPALKAVSPQAPISDWFVGDDFHHYGALSEMMGFNFFKSFGQPRPEPTSDWFRFPYYDAPDAYQFFLDLGPLKNVNEKYFHGNVEFWNQAMEHGTYDEFWKARSNTRRFNNVTPAVLTVGGWFDSEDLYGPLNIYQSIEAKNPGIFNNLVMGPWTHGGWFRGPGSSVGYMTFGGEQSNFFRDSIFYPFFNYYLKGDGELNLSEAYVFGTGINRWFEYDQYPPVNINESELFLDENGSLSFVIPKLEDEEDNMAFDEYISDPSTPAPYTANFHSAKAFYNRTYMTEDQRFASSRSDVLTYETEDLDEDLTIVGPIEADLFVSTTGTDADWVVKLIDVFPDSASNPDPNPNRINMAGYEMMIRYDILRGKFRNSLENPEPFTPDEITEINFKLNDIHHTFKRGHKIMVQIQSSMFPFFDRNPQTFCDIYNADEEDFIKALHKVYHTEKYPSKLVVNVLK